MISDYQFEVECKSCKITYVGMGNDQAFDCAAVYEDDIISGYYGSAVADLTRYKVISKPNWLRNGVICDDCIRKLIKKKNVEEIKWED